MGGGLKGTLGCLGSNWLSGHFFFVIKSLFLSKKKKDPMLRGLATKMRVLMVNLLSDHFFHFIISLFSKSKTKKNPILILRVFMPQIDVLA